MSSEFLAKHPALLILSLLPVIIASLVLAISFHPRIKKYVDKWHSKLVPTAYIVSRLGLFFIIYVLLGNRRIGGDIRWFQWEGLGALSGKLPYRDFECWHSPLFPYLMAIPYGIWHHIASGILAFIAFDLLCLIILGKLAKLILGSQGAKDAIWLWTLNPVIWLFTVRYGQDETVISAFLLLSIYLYARESRYGGTTALALGIAFTKLTTAFGALAILCNAKSKPRNVLWFAFLLAAAFVPFWLLGADILMPLRGQAASIEGLSFTSLIDRFILSSRYHLMTERAGSLIAFSLFFIMIWVSRKRNIPMIESLSLCLIVFLLFAPVSYKFYRIWFIGPLSIYALKTKQVTRFIVYSTMLSLFDDFVFRPGMPQGIIYVMGLWGLCVLCLEAKYAYDILSARRISTPSTSVE